MGSAEEEEWLDAMQLLFEKPDSQVLLSSGYGRDWPDARGVFVSKTQKFVAWINDVDHIRMAVMQSGSGLRRAFEHLCHVHSSLQATLEAFGHCFAWSSHLGFLTSCPSNLGTSLLASTVVRIPLLST